jgi:hypothetical protein
LTISQLSHGVLGAPAVHFSSFNSLLVHSAAIDTLTDASFRHSVEVDALSRFSVSLASAIEKPTTPPVSLSPQSWS